MTTGLTDLKSLEKDMFRKFYEDGLFDVYLGAMLVMMGISAAFADRLANELVSGLVALALAMAVTVPLLLWRRHLLRSRLGEFNPGPERRRKIRGSKLALLASVVVGIVVLGGTAAALGGDTSADTVGVVVGLAWFVNSVVVLGATAFFLDVPRFYAHGVVVGLTMPLLIWPDALWDTKPNLWLAFGLPGAIVVAVGLYKLVHFLQDYPTLATNGSIDERG